MLTFKKRKKKKEISFQKQLREKNCLWRGENKERLLQEARGDTLKT